MSAEWYHLSPVILNDTLWASMVPPCPESGTATQRQAAFLMAEQKAVDYIGTPLLETTVSGTFVWPRPYRRTMLPHDRVRSIQAIRAKCLSGDCDCTLDDEDACAILKDEHYGIIDTILLNACVRSGCGSCACAAPYQFYIEYRAGLPTGVAALDSSLHLGLAMAAQTFLNDMIDPGANEGGAGDPGVQSWASQGHQETRVKLRRTVFGASAVANRVADLLRHLRLTRPLGLR